MIEGILKEFAGSSAASGLLSQLTGNGLSAPQAQSALTATAEGAAQALAGGASGGDVSGMLGGLVSGLAGGGAGGMLGGLLGGSSGGGMGGMLGGLVGGLAGGGSPPGVPAGMIDSVAAFVAQKAGLSPEHAKMAVNVVLPQLLAFVKSKMA